MFKICILAAGKGTRNTAIEGLHKSLLPVSNKATISKILESVPKNIPIVIAVGFKAEQVVSYCNLTHSDRHIEYVYIDNFEGEGSGPGLSLLQCKNNLNCPFIFTAADTLSGTPDIFTSVDKNWVGVGFVSAKESYKYCLVKQNMGKIELFYQHNVDAKAFVGIAGIRDHDDFWECLSEDELIRGEHQVINGLRGLKSVHQKEIIWHDTGNADAYKKTKEIFPNDIVIEKNNEVLFIDNGWVVKYFASQKKLNDRVKRCEQLFNYAPTITKVNDNMMAYRYIEGERLSDIYDEKLLAYFLTDYYKNFAQPGITCSLESFHRDCRDMYSKKTHDRIEGFVGSPIDNITRINGVEVEPIKKLLKKINWDSLVSNAVPTCFHGDLQPENIIYATDPVSRFYYIDWRESFGNSIEVGDMYYDLGKLYHALIISNSLVLEGGYSVSINHDDSSSKIYYAVKNNLISLNQMLRNFCLEKDLDYRHVELVGILNYLNIASLYDNFEGGGYGRFLFLLGKKMLTQWIRGEKNESIITN